MTKDNTAVTPPSSRRRRWFGLTRRNLPGRFAILLLAILTLMVCQPLIEGHRFAQSLLTLALTVVILSALNALRSTRTFFAIGLCLMTPAFAGRIAMLFTPSYSVEMFASAFSSAFLLFIVVALVSRLFTTRQVTLDMIAASICAYLLLGVGWGFIFAMVELTHHGSFSAGLLSPTTSGHTAALVGSLHNFLYYSFVCLTTTGYGDIAPLSDSARILSVLESVIGQLYIAVLISRLVSIEVAQSMTKGE